jgi:thiamine-phosphate pyrophosphorylase
MPTRHPRLPRIWLMTDERQGDGLWSALERLPHGSGVIFRHHATPCAERRLLFEAVRRIARRRRLTLILAGPARLAIGWRADGVHGRRPRGLPSRRLIQTAPAHDRRERVAAERNGADLVLLSPVFSTRSHPGARPLGRVRFGLIADQATRPIIALGGMTAGRARSLANMGIYGWAAIDALNGTVKNGLNQNLKAVPI